MRRSIDEVDVVIQLLRHPTGPVEREHPRVNLASEVDVGLELPVEQPPAVLVAAGQQAAQEDREDPDGYT